jgi:deoxyribodipyrimidine photo-lyase
MFSLDCLRGRYSSAGMRELPPPDFPATREAAVDRMNAFLPRAGRAYAERRNYTLPGHRDVSRLSPYIRHRVLTEEELLSAVLQRHPPAVADKFVQEVFWRTYWKGWLEMRPSVWIGYRRGVARALDRLATESGLRRCWEAACEGSTGIDGFDAWARELVETGYLHNHARMWFASIWVFSLRLPWELGADFFLRHLLDGDPASNTLSWRWVAGLQTVGKTYVARPDNIAAYTAGRHNPIGLATSALPLAAGPPPILQALPEGAPFRHGPAQGLLITEEDLSPNWLLDDGLAPVATAILESADGRSSLSVSPEVKRFTAGLCSDLIARESSRLGAVSSVACTQDIVVWARRAGIAEVIAPYIPTGPAADATEGLARALADKDIRLSCPIRRYDLSAWPHAKHGFFRFREAIPTLLGDIGLATHLTASGRQNG